MQAGMSRELQQIAVHTQITDMGKNSNECKKKKERAISDFSPQESAVCKLASIPLPIMNLVTLAKIKLDTILNMEGRLW